MHIPIIWFEEDQTLQGTYLINFRPEPMFESFFSFAQLFTVFEHVQMGEDAHDFRESMNLTNVQKLKRLHLKPKTGVYEQQHLRCYIERH